MSLCTGVFVPPLRDGSDSQEGEIHLLLRSSSASTEVDLEGDSGSVKLISDAAFKWEQIPELLGSISHVTMLTLRLLVRAEEGCLV